MIDLHWILGWCGSFGGVVLATDLFCYVFGTPSIFGSPQPLRSSKHLHLLAYAAAYILGIARIPYTVLPYLAKFVLVVLFRETFWHWWHRYPIQAIRVGGDLINAAATTYLLMKLTGPDKFLFMLVGISLAAELIRLITEKVQMVVSGIWQFLPHRWIVRHIGDTKYGAFTRYCDYYRLPSEGRLEAIVQWLKRVAAFDPELADKLDYVTKFEIVADELGLRSGPVRDVARGVIYVHESWVNDPFLLIGQAFRRSPWVFDPRFLPRPFYYRTGSNQKSTLFVLQYAPTCPPYAWYQFGHEIKVARYDLFFRGLRWLGVDWEVPVQADGTYLSESLLCWLGLVQGEHHPLWTDDEVITQMAAPGAAMLSALEVAQRYCYPLKYVEEVLLGKIKAAQLQLEVADQPNAMRTTSATEVGASQWG